ncbi:MAG: LuxR C-terminal-related transcriptional regulator [Coriobacteriales bacterium]|jgi:DNA-binding CsgD family transcriptional regulator|nr:LuxR C-terminal-related transcriptional regulator [Coriobacteriales bacterium]
MKVVDDKAANLPTKPYRLLGLGFWQAWWMLAMCTDTVLSFDSDLGLVLRPALFVLLLTALGYLVVTLLSKWFSPFLMKNHFLWITALCAVLGTLAMAAIAHGAILAISPYLYTVAAIILSIGNALLLIMWGELWSALSTGRVGRHLLVSYVFAFVLYFCVYGLPLEWRIIITALLPALSVLILTSARKEPRRQPSSLVFDFEPFPVARLIVAIIIVSVAYGFSQAVIATIAVSEDTTVKGFILAGAGIAALALNIIITAPQLEPLSFFRPIVPALTGGLILMVLMQSDFLFVGGGLVILGIYCLDMLIMLVSTDMAFRTRLPVALTVGLTIFAARCGTLVGTFAFDVASGHAAWGAGLPQQLLLVCALVALLAGTILFSETDLLKLYRSRGLAVRQSAPALERCQRISSICGLTARELEVLVLLSSGRSVPFICQELSIAQGTAKHHVSNIYRKLGVGDRQGLYDVIERGSAGKGAL